MDRAAAALLGPNHLLGQQRYRLATTTIPGNDGDISLKIGEGGLMGDPLMVALFWVAFLPSTIRWQQLVAEEGAESGQLLAWHPWSGEKMDLSLSQDADDTTKQIVAEPGEHVQALAKRVRCSNDVFDRALAADGFSQNRGKEELLMHSGGRLALFADRRLVREGHVSLPGKVVTVARHLGSHLGEKASFTHELPRRRQARMAAFYSVGQLWYESRVSWRLKRCFFISRVVNTALSGNEAFCPSKAQYQALTSLVTCLARTVMAGAAARRGEHGRVRTLTNKEVLRFWKLALCDVEARVRRLKSAQTLVQDPSHHGQVLTAMFGKLPAEPSSTLGPDGEITPETNPWAVRWMEDLEALQPHDERGVVQRMGKNVRALFLDRELAADFVAIDVSVLRLQSLSTQVPPWDFREEVGHPMEVSQEGVPQRRCCYGDQCEAKFESFKALATHVLRHHRQIETVSGLVLTNQCPVCLAVYGDRKAAHRHLLSSLRRGSCRDRSRYLGQVHIPQSLCCPVCSGEPGNWSELQLHLAEHVSSVFNGLRNAGLGETQVGRGSAKSGSASGETGGGRRGQRARGSSTLGGRASYSVSGQRGRTERPDLHSVQDIPGPKLGKRGRSNGRGRSALPRLRWRNQEQARSRAPRRSRPTRSPFRVRVGSVPAQLGRDEGVGSRTRGSSEAVLGEQRVEERTSAVGIARSVLQSEAVQES